MIAGKGPSEAWSAYSGASRPPIPIEGGHRFRRKPATDSEAKRPLIPI